MQTTIRSFAKNWNIQTDNRTLNAAKRDLDIAESIVKNMVRMGTTNTSAFRQWSATLVQRRTRHNRIIAAMRGK
jgi:hypothetical protein